jgi:2-polyprenyl-6-methoxyphenol hydroxylase-like FAD-dependent oxidoreductase
VTLVHTAIIGAGPTGLFLGSALARRGHRVTVVDRDPGPRADGSWPRRGVMQFHHAHAFRAQAVQAVRTEMPDAYEGLLAMGAEPVSLQLPDGSHLPMGMRCRRQTFETALRASAVATPGLTLHLGHVDAVTSDEGRATGLEVDGTPLAADLVIDASGRAGRVTRSLRGEPTAGGTCGIAYVDRQYQLHAGAETGPLVNPIAWQANCDGYLVIIFIHELGIFSVLIVRPTDDRDLVGLRHEAAFTAACRAIPGLSDWTDPERSRPITPVLPGGTLMNYYRSQTGPDGHLALPGLLFVGDAVCTTTPNFGRGITTSLLQATEALRLIDDHGDDHVTLGEAFDAWCEANMRPWVEDHAQMDESIRRRWAGEDIDLSARLPSDLIMTAAEVDPGISPAVMPYMTMTALPSCLDAVEPLARAVYATGWRPATAPGPTRSELAELIGSAPVEMS